MPITLDKIFLHEINFGIIVFLPLFKLISLILLFCCYQFGDLRYCTMFVMILFVDINSLFCRTDPNIPTIDVR